MPSFLTGLVRDYQLTQILHSPPSAWEDISAHDLSWLIAIDGIYKELAGPDG